MSNEPHTTIHPKGGIVEYNIAGGVRKSFFNPASPNPESNREQLALPVWLLGKLEILAQSRFEMSDFAKKSPDQMKLWDRNDEAEVWSIVKSVNASSRIEGEGIRAEEVPMIFHAITRSAGQNSQELKDRYLAEKDISEAYFWALGEIRYPIVSYDFLLELHRRMFSSTRPEIAGRIKTKPVFIADDEKQHYDVQTLPPEKAELFLRTLCDRTARMFYEAERHARYSKMVIIAEFLVDFLAIHPFQDGNGRTARLLSTYLLERSGYLFTRFYPLDQVIIDDRNKYFEALFLAQSNWYQKTEDLLPWIEFYINAVFKQWERAFSEIRDRSLKKGTI